MGTSCQHAHAQWIAPGSAGRRTLSSSGTWLKAMVEKVEVDVSNTPTLSELPGPKYTFGPITAAPQYLFLPVKEMLTVEKLDVAMSKTPTLSWFCGAK
eukprot:1319777-Prymnesium_polylepis.2